MQQDRIEEDEAREKQRPCFLCGARARSEMVPENATVFPFVFLKNLTSFAIFGKLGYFIRASPLFTL